MRTCGHAIYQRFTKKKGNSDKKWGGASSSNQAVNGTVSKGRVGLGRVRSGWVEVRVGVGVGVRVRVTGSWAESY